MYTHQGKSLYLTDDNTVVEEGDVRAATLLVATGCQLTDEVAAQHGLPKRQKARAHAEEEDSGSEEPKSPAKQSAGPSQNKELRPAANKATKAD